MRIEAILFDLDGTLIDSAEDIGLALRKTLKEIGLEEYYPQNIRNYIGGGVKALLERILGDKFKEDYVVIFRKFYLENPVVYTRPYEGIPEILSDLKDKGYRLAVVSNKLEELSREILKRIGLIDYFDFIAGGDTFSEKKPSPVPVLKTLETIGGEPSYSLIVGDTEADIVAGKDAGIKTALAKWGYVRLNSVKPDFILNIPRDLMKIL